MPKQSIFPRGWQIIDLFLSRFFVGCRSDGTAQAFWFTGLSATRSLIRQLSCLPQRDFALERQISEQSGYVAGKKQDEAAGLCVLAARALMAGLPCWSLGTHETDARSMTKRRFCGKHGFGIAIASVSQTQPNHKKEHDVNNPMSVPNDRNGDILRVLLSIFLPPVGVFLQVGIGIHFWLNLLLTLCGYVPGIIHAVWVILRR